MASLAASPVCSSGLKKRSRLNEALDLIRKKRQRCVGDTNNQDETVDVSTDVAKYSQRHVDYFDHVKQVELARTKADYEQLIVKRDLEVHRLGQEIRATQEQMRVQAHDVVRLQGENRLLKRAVAIQNQQKEEVQHENKALKQLAAQAAEHMKRLEQANYTLRVHLQTSTSAAIGYPQPPDVY